MRQVGRLRRTVGLSTAFDSADQVRRLIPIPGVGKLTAEIVIAEIGVDMAPDPDAPPPVSGHANCCLLSSGVT